MAAALPFVRTPLLPAGVAIGSMAPDVPYFIPLGVPRHLTHTPTGVVTIDLAITATETEDFPVMRVLRDVELTRADMAFVNGAA